MPLRYVFNVDEELSLGWLETGSPRTVEAPFSAFLAAAVRDFARSSWFAGYSVQECVRACDDKRCSFAPHHGRWVFEAAADVDSSPVLTPEGVLVFGSDDKQVYALRGDP